ncbi:MAG: hypothetical protein IJ781_07935, partial [Atopobiaceae bacterium]|nr:hypothetical protein [Atopobiaceae bacterium]
MSIRTRALSSILSVALVWSLTPVGAIASEEQTTVAPEETVTILDEGISGDGQTSSDVPEGQDVASSQDDEDVRPVVDPSGDEEPSEEVVVPDETPVEDEVTGQVGPASDETLLEEEGEGDSE